jgi:DNA-binding cell septation regulator SpoVG
MTTDKLPPALEQRARDIAMRAICHPITYGIDEAIREAMLAALAHAAFQRREAKNAMA